MPLIKSTMEETEEWDAKRQMWVKKKKAAKKEEPKKEGKKLKEAYNIRKHRKERRAMIDQMLEGM